MQWTDEAIILSHHKFSENSAVIRVFGKESGLFAGASRSALSKKNRAIYESGNFVKAQWSARLAEHLGTIQCELTQPIAAFIMHDAAKLYAMQSLLAIIEKSFAERDPHQLLYSNVEDYLKSLATNTLWREDYIKLELLLLSEAGFRLELDKCAATGTSDKLTYVSPKSGRAVSAEAGAPYKEKLLPLPSFLKPNHAINEINDMTAILDGARLTGYFLQTRIFETNEQSLPSARDRLIHYWMKHQQTS